VAQRVRSWHRIFYRLLALLIVALAANMSAKPVAGRTYPPSDRPLASYCDPVIGADGGANSVPGAAVPFGFANPSSETMGHDTSGYDSRQPIIGFSQTQAKPLITVRRL